MRELDKINRGSKYSTGSRRLEIGIFNDSLPRKLTIGNLHDPRPKMTCGCRNKGTFEEGWCDGSSTSERSICQHNQHNISATQERENILINYKSAVFKTISSLSRVQDKRSKTTETGLRPASLLKKRLWHRCFSVNFGKFLKTPFLHRTSPDDWFCQKLFWMITKSDVL